MKPTTGPRIGPQTTATGELTIWARLINGRHLMFWAWPDYTAVYHVPNHGSVELIRTFTKETH